MSRIKNFVRYSIENSENAKINAIENPKSLVLRYPCQNESVCVPYELTLSPGVYKIECWGSIGQQWKSLSHPGLGAYTKGTIFIANKQKLYIYIGAKGPFNSVRDIFRANSGFFGGGATDVRLDKGDFWYNQSSLISRIMVAAGGGGAEWKVSYGGNGGKLVGEHSVSAETDYGGSQYEEICPGANQTSGSHCPSYLYRSTYYPPFIGEFGSAGLPSGNSDYGGFGGGGYYGGTSYYYAFSGSGGSSFISGYKGCDAVKNTLPVEHTGSPFHYSGLVFYNTEMIEGNKTMPLPTGGKGIYDDSRGGAFRIEVVSYSVFSCKYVHSHLSHTLYVFIILVS